MQSYNLQYSYKLCSLFTNDERVDREEGIRDRDITESKSPYTFVLIFVEPTVLHILWQRIYAMSL